MDFSLKITIDASPALLETLSKITGLTSSGLPEVKKQEAQPSQPEEVLAPATKKSPQRNKPASLPKEETPKEETPKEEAPKEEAPKEEAPKEEAPKEGEYSPETLRAAVISLVRSGGREESKKLLDEYGVTSVLELCTMKSKDEIAKYATRLLKLIEDRKA